MVIKGQPKVPCGDGTVQSLDHDDRYSNPHMIKLYRTKHTHMTSENREIQLKPMDYINPGCDTVLWFYKMFHQGKLGKGYKASLWIISYNCM